MWMLLDIGNKSIKNNPQSFVLQKFTLSQLQNWKSIGLICFPNDIIQEL